MMEQDLWGRIDIEKWDQTPHLRKRTATESDVINGIATFYLQGTNNHTPIDIKIPSLGFLTDEETNEKIQIVVIQAELADGRKLIGYRPLKGGNGVCTLDEVTFM